MQQLPIKHGANRRVRPFEVTPTPRGTVMIPIVVGQAEIVVEFTMPQWRQLAADVQKAFAGIAAEREMWADVIDIERWESVT